MSKLKKILKDLNIIQDKSENNVINNLLKVPKREDSINAPHIQNDTKDAIHQADLLFLPDDDGYKYTLVVIDLATSTLDAEPLKNKESKTVGKALKKIYKRKFLNT